MRFARVDWVPLIAIAVGGTLGPLFIATAIDEAGDDDDHMRHESIAVTTVRHVDHDEAAVDAPAVIEQPRIPIRGDLGIVFEPKPEVEPLIYVDGVRLAGDASIEGIDPNTIDRIEIVKGGAAVDLFGADAEGGVIQIFLKVESGDKVKGDATKGR